MWMVEIEHQDKMKSLSQRKKLLQEFETQILRIKKNVYSNRRQIQHAFKMIKSKYTYYLKVAKLQRSLSRTLGQNQLLRWSYFQI